MNKISEINTTIECIALIEHNCFGAIICNSTHSFLYHQVPFLLQYDNNGDDKKLYVMLHKTNVNINAYQLANQILCVFQGPQCYISPSWTIHENYMDWNCKNVQVSGYLKSIELEKQNTVAKNLLSRLEQKVERKYNDNYNEALILQETLNNYTVFEIEIGQIETKFNAQQNLTENEQLAIIRELKKQSDFNAMLVAFEMEETLKKSRRILKAVKNC